MKTTITVNDKDEARRLLEKKRPIKISVKFPNYKFKDSREFWLIAFCWIAITIFVGVSTHFIGYREGSSEGIERGYDIGYRQAVNDVISMNGLSLSEAIAWNVRLNMDSYIAWLGIVLGLAWIIHGVGFFIVKG